MLTIRICMKGTKNIKNCRMRFTFSEKWSYIVIYLDNAQPKDLFSWQTKYRSNFFKFNAFQCFFNDIPIGISKHDPKPESLPITPVLDIFTSPSRIMILLMQCFKYSLNNKYSTTIIDELSSNLIVLSCSESNNSFLIYPETNKSDFTFDQSTDVKNKNFT